MARTSTRRWKGCQLCKPWKFAGDGDSERIPARELRRMGGRRGRVSRKEAGQDWGLICGREELGHVARRIDFYDDPAAPAANSFVPSVNVVVTNADGDVLLIRQTDNQNWALPGGAIDLGESMGQASVRETKEETGI